MRLSEEQAQQYAKDFEVFENLTKHPGWRILIEDPLNSELEWAENEMHLLLVENRNLPVEEIKELQQYRRALEFVYYQILRRQQLGRECFRVLQQRAEGLGLAAPAEIPVPKFQEVR